MGDNLINSIKDELLKLIKVVGEPIFNEIMDAIKRDNMLIMYPHPGAIWMSEIKGGMVSSFILPISSYYHPDKPHTATTVGRLGKVKSMVEADKWAVSRQTKSLWGNKSYYNTL